MLACILTRWQPGIGDPNWQGWATVLVYLITALLAWRVAGRAGFPAASRGREQVFWGTLALIMGALAINKQLDLQSAVTMAGRCLVRAEGWDAERRLLQLGFLIAIAVLALILLAGLARLLRGSGSRSALPVAGLTFVCAFVLMRAVSFHHADRLLGLPILGLRANMVLEWTGPLLICLGAVRCLRLLPPVKPRSRVTPFTES